MNKVFLLGRLIDKVRRVTSSGLAITSLSIDIADGVGGNVAESRDIIDVQTFGKLADSVDLINPGSIVLSESHIKTTQWTDRSGQTRINVGVVADAVRVIRAVNMFRQNISAVVEQPAAARKGRCNGDNSQEKR